MKLAYDRLDKNAKRKLLIDYKKTSSAKSQLFRLKRLFFLGISLFIIGLYLMYDLIISEADLLEYPLALLSVGLGLFFFFGSFYLKRETMNNFLIDKKNK